MADAVWEMHAGLAATTINNCGRRKELLEWEELNPLRPPIRRGMQLSGKESIAELARRAGLAIKKKGS